MEWECEEDSDTEIPEMVALKNDIEKKLGVKFSKRGIIDLIDKTLEKENPNNKENPENAKKWECRLDIPTIRLHLKKGGSDWDKSSPYLRTETVFDGKYDIIQMKNIMFHREHTKEYNKY